MQPNDSLEGGSHSDSLSPAGRCLGAANEEIADITPALKLVRVAPAGGGGTVGVPAADAKDGSFLREHLAREGIRGEIRNSGGWGPTVSSM